MRRSTRVHLCSSVAFLSVAAVLVCAPSTAAAQEKEPIGGFVADIRGVFAKHKLEPDVAQDLNVIPGNLPTRSYGLSGGAHVFPLRIGKVTFGFGGEVIVSRGSNTLTPDTTTTTTTATTTTPPKDFATVRRHFLTIAPEVSFNFGHHNGWSYISGGLFGVSKLYLDRADKPGTDAPFRSTLNYGAGARWFTNHRMAFSVDIRWFTVSEQQPTATVVHQPHTTLMVLRAGIALR